MAKVDKKEFKFVVKAALVVPAIRLQLDKPIYIKLTEIFVVTPAKGEEPEKTHATCIDLQTGESGRLWVDPYLNSVLQDAFPEASYVGKSFQIIKHPKPSGKGYHTFTVNEIEVE